MFRTLTVTGALAALCLVGSGCTVEGQVHTAGYVSTPDLVLIEPGLYVVADYSYPLFYSDGYYWRYNNGYWLRSPSYRDGWVRVTNVPYTVRRIDRPNRYVHYHPSSRAQVYRAPVSRGAPPRRVEVRDHRPDQRVEVRDNRFNNQRVEVRDHRSDQRVERRDERHDNRTSREDKRDHRSDGNHGNDRNRRDHDRDRD